MADEKISDMANNHPLSTLDGTEWVPLIKIGDTTNYASLATVVAGSVYRSASSVVIVAGSQTIDFSSQFVDTYSLQLTAWDSGGQWIQLQLLSRDKNGFSIYSSSDGLLDYDAKVPQ